MNLYQRVLGIPFVYNHIRPLAVGGIDMSPFYDRVLAQADDVVLDVGCGTGDALTYLKSFQRYVGIDTDSVAIDFAKKTYGSDARASFQCKMCTDADVTELQPSWVMFCGLLHHLTDDQVLGLFRMSKQSTKLRRIITSDIVYLDGELVNNAFARMDRGKYCRRQEQYLELVLRSGLRVVESEVVKVHPTRGRTKLFLMTVEP